MVPTETTDLMGSVQTVVRAVADILQGAQPSVYLYGSVTSNDFRFGWSDIDLLVLTETPVSPRQAERLVCLRQTLTAHEPENPYYRLCEGAVLPLSAFLTGAPCTVVYWGTSGERLTEHYAFSSFSRWELLYNGVLLSGADVRGQMEPPSYADLRADTARHLSSVRQYADKTCGSLYAFGWLLDISRGFYTLRTGRVISKTEAAVWVLKNGLCPVPEALETALTVRRSPALFQADPALRACAAELGPSIRTYADALEDELERAPHRVFGARQPVLAYFDRPGAYLIAVRGGKVAVIQTKKGLFLPGGGLDAAESDKACIMREALEETGCTAAVGAFLCSAETYTVHEKNGPFHPIQSYYTGALGEQTCAPSEPGRRLLWLPPAEACGRLCPEMQNWALDVFLRAAAPRQEQ